MDVCGHDATAQELSHMSSGTTNGKCGRMIPTPMKKGLRLATIMLMVEMALVAVV